MRVVLYEPDYTGHHFAYLARMLPGFLALPIETIIATTAKAVNSVEYQKTLKPFEKKVRIETCCRPPSAKPLAHAWHCFREARHVAKALQADHLAIICGEGLWPLAAAWGVLGRGPFPANLAVETWLYRGGFVAPEAHSVKSRIKRRLFDLLLKKKTFAGLHLDHEFLYEYARSRTTGSGDTRVFLSPNPVVIGPGLSKQDARQRLALPLDGRLIVFTGTVTGRKGADLLLQALCNLRSSHNHLSDRLVFAGPFEERIKSLLKQDPYPQLIESGTLICVDRFLDSQEMYLFAAAGDLTVAPYPNYEGRSSIILWAAAAGRPCLGTQDSCVGYVIEKERLGVVCDVTNAEAFTKRLSEALNMPWTTEDQQRVRAYAQFHSIENYQRVGTTLLRQRCQAENKTLPS